MDGWGILLVALAAVGAAAVLAGRARATARHLAGELERAGAREEALRRRLEQLEVEAGAQRAALLQSMGEGVLLLDCQDRVELANRAFDQLFGGGADLRGRTVLEATRSHELEGVVRQARATGQVLGAEIELRTPTPRLLQVNAARHGAGPEAGLILVFHDLTRFRQLEEQRREFVANVSHELRTPLSLIKGYVETLRDGATQDPELNRRFLQTIARHTDRLTYLIEAHALTPGVRHRRLNPSPVQLRALAARTCEDLGARAAARGTTLRNQVPADLEAHADPDRTLQVLFNLVDNALKYGRPQGQVELGGRVRDEQWVELWVRDDGPGLPREALGRLFERFYRVDRNRSREQGGTGLGLAIVKHIVQSHGGEVRAESGRGATFYFTLPRR